MRKYLKESYARQLAPQSRRKMRVPTYLITLALCSAGCAIDSPVSTLRPESKPPATLSGRNVRQMRDRINASEVGPTRLGCLVVTTRGNVDSAAVYHIEGGQLGLASRSGALIIRDLTLPSGAHAMCFVRRDEDTLRLRNALSRFSDASRGSRLRSIKLPPQNGEPIGLRRIWAATTWLKDQLETSYDPALQASLRVNRPTDLSLRVGDPNSRPYFDGPQSGMVTYIPATTYVIVDLNDLAWKLKNGAPESISAYFPTAEQLALLQACNWANAAAQELDYQSQILRSEYDNELSAFQQEGSGALECEKVTQASNEICISLWIRERWIWGFGNGDAHGPESNAPRKKSRVEFNLDLDNLKLNVFVNSSDVTLPGMTVPNLLIPFIATFGPDGGVVYNLPETTVPRPATVKRIEFHRVNGDNNTVNLKYSLWNNVCTTLPVPACPAIDGDITFRKVSGTWQVDPDNSYMDLFPAKQFNRWNPATNLFEQTLYIPNLLPSTAGLTTNLSISDQLRAEINRLFQPVPGCQPY